MEAWGLRHAKAQETEERARQQIQRQAIARRFKFMVQDDPELYRRGCQFGSREVKSNMKWRSQQSMSGALGK